jgi:hypothetical protein
VPTSPETLTNSPLPNFAKGRVLLPLGNARFLKVTFVAAISLYFSITHYFIQFLSVYHYVSASRNLRDFMRPD